jgi:hypothetical protein
MLGSCNLLGKLVQGLALTCFMFRRHWIRFRFHLPMTQRCLPRLDQGHRRSRCEIEYLLSLVDYYQDLPHFQCLILNKLAFLSTYQFIGENSSLMRGFSQEHALRQDPFKSIRAPLRSMRLS